ncbi:MAG TPA: c-type cytochrome, partial [Sideroxyarcus sp.]|nr:c-type cytochrome [Sideroxyarcus sp.]
SGLIRNIFVLWTCAALLGVSLPGAASAADVTKLVEPCTSCHGKRGVSTEAEVPSIAGYSEDYFTYSLDMYLKRERPCIEAEYHAGRKKGQKTSMCEIVKDMSESDIELMAGYFARQKSVPTAQVYDAELAKKGEAIHMDECDECHDDAGRSPADNAGILGGQKMDYLREQIRFVRDGKRFTSKKMRVRLEMLDDADLEAVVHYYGSIQ